MGIQGMHNNTGFFPTSCVDWTAVEDSSQLGFRAYNSQFSIRGAVIVFLMSLNLERV